MLKIAWRGVVHNPGRYIATLVAIITGVAFFAATGFISDRIVDALQGDVNRQYGNVDLAVVHDESSANGAFVSEQRISGSTADQIFAARGVEARAGIVTGSVAFQDQNGKPFANGTTGRLWIADDTLNPMDIEEGSAPSSHGQIVIDRGLASRNDLKVGDRVVLLTLAGQQDVEVVGIAQFGNADSIDSGGTVFLSEADAFNWLTSGIREYEAIYLRSDVPQTELMSEIEPLVPDGFQAQTGDQFLKEKRDSIGATGRYLGRGLQAFAVLAMLVGGFVIYNTFNVIVSQRVRELAVMSAVGATPRQILSSLLYEGLVIGIVGSILGIVVGFGLVFLLIAALDVFGVSLPGSGLVVGPANVIGGVLIGTIITVFSVMIPARRAARTEPIEALRSSSAETTPMSRKRVIVTLALIGLGIAGLLFGGSWPAIAISALMLFVGVVVAGPILAVIGARIIRPVMRVFGLEGRLAVDNSARNPQRTATTSNALLIGVFLVTFVLVAGTSLKDFVVDQIKQLESADYLIHSTGGTIDDGLISDLLSINDVESVTPFRREAVTIGGNPGLLTTGDVQALTSHAKIDVKEGSLEELKPGTIALVVEPSSTDSPTIGSTVKVADNAGNSADLKVVAIIGQSVDTLATGSIVDTETFDSLVGDTAPTLAFIDVAPNAPSETADAIKDRVSLRPDIDLTEGNSLARLIGSVFDFMIRAVNGLLAMSVVIALIGIVNTLSLSIIERRRELGLLRAIGMTDRKVQAMVRLESVIIAALGTFSGMALGLFFGWTLILAINRLSGADINLGLPWFTLALVVVLGPVLGLLASIIPASRSTRLDVLDSLAAT